MIAFDPYAAGVLKPEHHDRLVADLTGFASDAGIQPRYICEPLPDHLPEKARAYLREFRRHTDAGTSGLVFVGGNPKGRVEAYTSAMAGALVRNFIRARVMTLGVVIDALAKQGLPNLSCLLIPNFFLAAAEAGTVASWQANAIYDHLMHRHVAGLQTVVYASSFEALGNQYGVAFKRLLDNHYVVVAI